MQIHQADDLDAAQALLAESYGHMRLSSTERRSGPRVRISSNTVGLTRLDRLRMDMAFTADVTPPAALLFYRVRDGRPGIDAAAQARRHRPGDLALSAQPDQSYRAVVEHTDIDVAVIDPTLLTALVVGPPGHTDAPVRLTGYRPVSEGARERWNHTYDHLQRQAAAHPEAMTPLVAAESARLLAAVSLMTFPNTAVTDPGIEDRRDAHPATLRRAVAFIDTDPGADITLADIAAAAHVSIRAVQLAFRRHLDTTPTGYLRRSGWPAPTTTCTPPTRTRPPSPQSPPDGASPIPTHSAPPTTPPTTPDPVPRCTPDPSSCEPLFIDRAPSPRRRRRRRRNTSR